MSDAPDELESAMILGDPGETVSLDTIKAMARAVRDAGFIPGYRAGTVTESTPFQPDPDIRYCLTCGSQTILKDEA